MNWRRLACVAFALLPGLSGCLIPPENESVGEGRSSTSGDSPASRTSSSFSAESVGEGRSSTSGDDSSASWTTSSSAESVDEGRSTTSGDDSSASWTTSSSAESIGEVALSTGRDEATSEGSGSSSSSPYGGSGHTDGKEPSTVKQLSFGERIQATIRGVTEDTFVRDGSSARPRNFGTSPTIDIDGAAGTPVEVGLLRFDLEALSGELSVVGAQLHLVPLSVSYPGEVQVHSVTEAWVAGDWNGSLGVPNWTFREEGVAWSVPGVVPLSEDSRPVATFAVEPEQGPIAIELPAALVQAWLDDPGSNWGLAFLSHDARVDLRSSQDEHRGEAAPVLTVEYREPGRDS